jgi:hypothetical protein
MNGIVDYLSSSKQTLDFKYMKINIIILFQVPEATLYNQY